MAAMSWHRWLQTPSPTIRVLLTISALCLLGSLAGVTNWLDYQRVAVADGEVWRLVTAWMAQLNPAHWLVNQGGLVLLALLLPGDWQRQDTRAFAWVWLLSSLWLAFGPYDQYAGLSGLLYGWLLWALWRSPHYSSLIRLAVAVILAIKVISENLSGPNSGGASGVSGFIRGDIAVQSHLAGLIAGALAVLVAWGWRRARNRH
ncbi:rhombosortase [Saccharospirillum impatiens]|uniref:rhombosortase n=1 Tax=Saccharospirillum impatiens TaxID=169438 RepID=UPI00048DFEF9|nr:rhombosortase [Saccharospirillum impatiens]